MKKNRSKIYLIITLIIFGIAFSIDAQDKSWELRKEGNGIKAYTREVPNSKLLQVRTVSIFETSMEHILSVTEDISRFHKWMYKLADVKELERINSKENIVYYEFEIPWPMENRYSVVKKERIQKGDVWIVKSHELPDYVSTPKNGGVKMEQLIGIWTFTPIYEGKIMVEYELSSNPGGNIPSWLINMFITSGPFKTFSNLKAEVEESYLTSNPQQIYR